VRAFGCWGLILAMAASPGVAQEPRGVEAGLAAVATLADHDYAGGGLALGVRPGGGARIGLTLLAGALDQRFAARGELTGQLLLSPLRRHGIGVYGLAGVAAVVGPRDEGVLVLGIGVEAAPAGRSGWYLEAGVGGGVRIAGGWRWRWLRPPVTAPP
jgi:hypothetical protein